MVELLPRLISNNQFEADISLKFLLAQEIYHGIRDNTMSKLDMSKAYDKLSWNFLSSFFTRLNFVEPLIQRLAPGKQVVLDFNL